jgi:hypothetical protein
LYRRNAFRLTGLPLTTGARDLARFGQRMEMLHRLNGGALTEPQKAFPAKPPPSFEDIREALQRLRDPEQRLVDEFFWFWPMEWSASADDDALAALAYGQTKRSMAIWRDAINSADSRPAALHNLAVLEHISAVEADSKIGISGSPSQAPHWRGVYQLWGGVLRERAIWTILNERVLVLDDPRLTPTFVSEFRESLPNTLLAVSVALARRSAERGENREAGIHSAAIRESGFQAHIVEGSLKRLIEPESTRITTICDTATANAQKDARSGAAAAAGVLEQGGAPLASVDALLPAGDPKREDLHDRVADAALSCLVRYGNATKDWKRVIPIAEAIGRVAGTSSVQERVAANLETAKNNLELNTCWYCKERPSDEERAYKVGMHGDVERGNQYIGGRQVRWRQHTVEVPRCKDCAESHTRIRSYTTTGFWWGVLIGLGSCGVTADRIGDQAVLLLLLCVVVGAILGNRIGWSHAPDGMRREVAGRESPMVLGLLHRGWQFGDKPEGVN